MENNRKPFVKQRGKWRKRSGQRSSHSEGRSGEYHPQNLDIKANQVGAQVKVRQIPGFYFDAEKKKYFRITSSHPAPKVCSVSKTMGNDVDCKIKTRQFLKSNYQLGLVQLTITRQQGLKLPEFQRTVTELCIKNLKEYEIWPPLNSNSAAVICHNVRQIESDIKQKRLLRIWRSGNYKSKVQKFDIQKQKNNTLAVEMVGEIVPKLRNSPVTSVSWSPHESTSDLFVCSMLGNEYTKGGGVQLCSWNGTIPCIHYVRHRSVWTASWNTNTTYSHYISLGATGRAAVLDINTLLQVNYLTADSDIFSTVFSTRDSLLYCGARNGNIHCLDFRTHSNNPNPFCASSSSVSCMSLLNNENYLLASSLDGSIKKFDLRVQRCVQQYHGQVNDGVQNIPFKVDEKETFLYAPGIDGKVNIWSLQTGQLLHTVLSCTQPDVIPAVSYGNSWGGGFGVPGLILSVGEKMIFYSLFQAQ